MDHSLAALGELAESAHVVELRDLRGMLPKIVG